MKQAIIFWWAVTLLGLNIYQLHEMKVLETGMSLVLRGEMLNLTALKEILK